MDTLSSISSLLPLRTPPSSPSTSSTLHSSLFHFSATVSSRTIFATKASTLRFRNNSSYALPQFRVRCGSGVIEIDETKFKDTVLNAKRPVLVEFVANWCGPCRLISPAIKSLAQEYEDRLAVVKIDHDANPKLIKEYKVYGLPTLILFNNGQEVPESRREGAITKVKLKQYVDAFLESISVP